MKEKYIIHYFKGVVPRISNSTFLWEMKVQIKEFRME